MQKVTVFMLGLITALGDFDLHANEPKIPSKIEYFLSTYDLVAVGEFRGIAEIKPVNKEAEYIYRPANSSSDFIAVKEYKTCKEEQDYEMLISDYMIFDIDANYLSPKERKEIMRERKELRSNMNDENKKKWRKISEKLHRSFNAHRSKKLRSKLIASAIKEGRKYLVFLKRCNDNDRYCANNDGIYLESGDSRYSKYLQQLESKCAMSK